MTSQEVIPLSVPSIGDLEFSYVADAVRSGYVSSVGAYVNRFEEEFAAAVGAKYAVACATGTAALHIALKIVGVEPGWNEITTTMTITGGEQLEMGEYQARLVEADKRTAGRYTATMCISNQEPIRFVGIWAPEKQQD